MSSFARHQIVLAALLLALAGGAVGQDKKRSYVVREAVFELPVSLDPHLLNHPDYARFWAQAYESPLACDPTGSYLTLRPWLLEAMPELSPDGLSMTFSFKAGLRFHDDPCFEGGKGREVVAEDFVNVLRRHVDPASRSPFWHNWLSGRIPGLDELRLEAEQVGALDWLKPISGVQVESRYRIRLHFTSANAVFLSLLAMPWLAMLPREAMVRYGAQLGERMVGTGPYVHDREASNAETLVFKADPDYWNAASGTPGNAGVVFAKLERSELHDKRFALGDLTFLNLYADNIGNWLTPKGKLRIGIKPATPIIVRTDLLRLHHLTFNMRNKILAKKTVRQALCLALDRSFYVDRMYRGAATLADHLVPPTLPLDAPGTAYPWEFGKQDLKRAAALLAEAGHPAGAGLPEFILDYPNTTPLGAEECEFLKSSWEKIGVKVQVRRQEFPEMARRVKQGLGEIGVSFWFADYPDAENFFLIPFSKNAPHPDVDMDAPNAAYYANPTYDALYLQSAAMPPGAARGRVFDKMIRILQEDCPMAFLCHPAELSLVHPSVAFPGKRTPYAASLALVRAK